MPAVAMRALSHCRPRPHCRLPRLSAPRRAAGMALVAVLWVVAALSLMVMGLAASTRTQIEAAILQRDSVSAQALGDAAINLALQQMQAQPDRDGQAHSQSVDYQGQRIGVDIAPLNGLISLNGADAGLLESALQAAGGLPAPAAQALAQTIVRWRDTPPALEAGASAPAPADMRRPPRFEAVEDLLLVPGMDYALYARIAPLFNADASDRQVNPGAAPPGVRAALGSGSPQPLVRGNTVLYRLQASVPLEAGKILRLTRDVALQPDTARGLPWRTLRESRRVQTADS